MAAKLAQGAGDFASITWAPAGVPGVGDTADSNGYAVTITSNVTCDALVNTNAGAGGFTCSTAGVTITAAVTATVRTVLTVSNASGTVTVTGNSTGGSSASVLGIIKSGNGALTVSGQAIGGTAASAYGVSNASGAGTVTVTTAVGNSFGPGGIATSAAGVYGSNAAGAITRVFRAISGPYGQAACAGAVTMVADTRNYSTWQKSDSTGLRALVGPTWPVQPWYQAPSAATCQAAYDSVGATDLADSYTNEANPGTYNAAPGVAPTWTDDVGWGFTGTQYLTTGINPVNGQSIIARCSGLAASGTMGVVGSTDGASVFYYLQIASGVYYGAGSWLLATPRPTDGIFCVAGQYGYRNGVIDTPAITAGAGLAHGMYIGARNNAGTPGQYLSGTIAAVAIYSATLTQNDVEIVVVEMARLPRAAAGAVYISPGMFAAMGGVRIRPLIGGVG